MDCARLTSSFVAVGSEVGLRDCRKGEDSEGVPEPPTKRDTTSLLLLPVLGVPLKVDELLSVDAWLFSRDLLPDSGNRSTGVAVARDIFVVVVAAWELDLCRSRSVMTFASAEWRACCFSLPPFESFSLLEGE